MTTAATFSQYELRTIDVNAARAFYADVLGAQFWSDEIRVAPMPERAAALGAPPHWLGHIATSNVDGTADQVVAHGGKRLGPTQRGPDGSLRAVLRDPFGALMAVASLTVAPRHGSVAWHLHHSENHERTFAWYAAMFGWTATELADLGPQLGSHQEFAWDESGRTVGSMANTALLPHIHPQWLFFFRVADIEAALARVRASGGTVLEPTHMSSGDILAPCEDPQRGAFALYEFAR